MLRLIRSAVLMLAVFVAGMFFERAHQIDLCEASGGVWLKAGFCGEAE